MLYRILTIQKQTEENIKVQIELNSEDPVFEGHFPGKPVLPGACMVQMLKEILEKATDQSLLFIKAGNIKYISLVTPDNHKALTFDIHYKSAEEGKWSVTSVLYADETVSMKFSGMYKLI